MHCREQCRHERQNEHCETDAKGDKDEGVLGCEERDRRARQRRTGRGPRFEKLVSGSADLECAEEACNALLSRGHQARASSRGGKLRGGFAAAQNALVVLPRAPPTRRAGRRRFSINIWAESIWARRHARRPQVGIAVRACVASPSAAWPRPGLTPHTRLPAAWRGVPAREAGVQERRAKRGAGGACAQPAAHLVDFGGHLKSAQCVGGRRNAQQV